LAVQRLHPQARFPQKAHASDVGFDIFSTNSVTIGAQSTGCVPTGIACRPPLGSYLQIGSRSSLAAKGVVAVGGVIDPNYTGEVTVLLHNSTDTKYVVDANTRIAQLIPLHFAHPNIVEVSSLGKTDRGTNGFGSTG
ncbi:deoxyuridine 5'-triphosphate nucleotidohydrolase, partial [Linderina pennispora]